MHITLPWPLPSPYPSLRLIATSTVLPTSNVSNRKVNKRPRSKKAAALGRERLTISIKRTRERSEESPEARSERATESSRLPSSSCEPLECRCPHSNPGQKIDGG